MDWFKNITVSNQAIEDLRELIPLSIMQDEDFNRFITLMPAVHGERMGFIGDMNDVGINGSGCDPVYHDVSVANSEKIWDLGDWQIPIKICYEALVGTIAEYTLKTGTEIGDLTDTEFMSYIIRPALETQMRRMIWRFGWFGDKNAANVSSETLPLATVSPQSDEVSGTVYAEVEAGVDGAVKCATADKEIVYLSKNSATGTVAGGTRYFTKSTSQTITIEGGGVITDGVNPRLFKTTDGLFKKMMTRIASNEDQRTVIAANTEATYKAQKAKLLEKGVATTIFENILMDADPRISEDEGAIILCTKSLADALKYDIKKTYNTQLEWDTIFDGFQVSQWDGVTIARISIWDRFIRAYQNDGVKLNNPHRAVYVNPSQLLVGSPKGNMISNLDIWFDRKERRNYIYSTGKMGTMIKEDDMFHIAI
nr:MAG TPA: major capsid protein [Caudoviricetes sp.]